MLYSLSILMSLILGSYFGLSLALLMNRRLQVRLVLLNKPNLQLSAFSNLMPCQQMSPDYGAPHKNSRIWDSSR